MLAELENLFALQDKNYREFHARLMPNIEKDRIIGIRVPVLRKYAKELASGSRLFLSVQNEKENDCDKYYQYNKKLLFDKQQEEILSEMDEIEQDLNTVIK